MKKSNLTNTMILAVIFGVISGAIAAFVVVEVKMNQAPSKEELVRDFYMTETAVHVSPHGLRKHMGEDPNVVLVDLRSQEEYEEEHIIGAINIPAYKDRDHSDYGAVDRIVGSFKEIQSQNPETEFIVYCYSIPCMTGRKVGNILAQNEIYVKHLGVGWNEWRYFWTMWNHAHEWEVTNVEDYVVSGSEPGVLVKDSEDSMCPIEGELGC